MGFHPVGVHVVAVGKRFLRVIMVEILISFHLNCSLNDFGFDFQRDEVSFSFLLSHPTALSCIISVYEGEYSRERLVQQLARTHPKTITQLAQKDTGSSANRHMRQILRIYNGASREMSLPLKN